MAHVAINSGDMDRSMAFYERIFGWSFHPWGPPGFYQIERPTAPELFAALQENRELVAGTKTVGFECTVAVDDVRAALALVVELGGKIVMEPVTIPTVCELAWVEDPCGNVLGIAHYETGD